MFENELSAKLKRIFKVKKVSYDEPGESGEQECLFVNVETSDNRVRKGKAIAKVSGTCIIIGNAEKLNFGFFSKAIQEASPSDTKDFFFSDFESNTKRHNNLVQRSFNFIYFFSGQYDPKVGTITTLDLDIIEE